MLLASQACASTVSLLVTVLLLSIVMGMGPWGVEGGSHLVGEDRLAPALGVPSICACDTVTRAPSGSGRGWVVDLIVESLRPCSRRWRCHCCPWIVPAQRDGVLSFRLAYGGREHSSRGTRFRLGWIPLAGESTSGREADGVGDGGARGREGLGHRSRGERGRGGVSDPR